MIIYSNVTRVVYIQYIIYSSYHALARGFLACLQGGHRQGARKIITLDLLNIKK